MLSIKFLPFLVLSMTAMVIGRATPDEMNARSINDVLVPEDACNNHLGRCDQNGCAGVFPTPNSIHGTCTAGKFNGCPCNKCGDKTGGCDDNGCFGQNGVCTQGNFQGCPCK